MLFLANCPIRFPHPLALSPLIAQRSAASGEPARLPRLPVWVDDDAPPLTGISPTSHASTCIRCPAGQGMPQRASWTPAIHCRLRTAHSTDALQAAGGAPSAERAGVVSRPTGHQGYRCLAPSWRWRAKVARQSTQHRKRGSPAGARGDILERRARWHFSAVARCCCQTPR